MIVTIPKTASTSAEKIPFVFSMREIFKLQLIEKHKNSPSFHEDDQRTRYMQSQAHDT